MLSTTTRLERGAISGASPEVLDSIAKALRLDDSERAHLFDLAHAASPVARQPKRRNPKDCALHPSLQWALDAVTAGPAFVRNGRMDLLAVNPLARAFYADVYDMPGQPPNIARYTFLDERAYEFYPDWDLFAEVTVAILRTEAGRDPHNKELHDLIGELGTRSEEFRRRWGAHNVRLAPDFVVEDVWALATPGGPDEFARLVAQFDAGNFPDGAPLVVRFLWKARWKIGALLGLDGEDTGIGSRVPSLTDRLPSDLREAPTGPELGAFPFTSLYQVEHEWAAEMANRTVHTILHLGWVQCPDGGHHGQMAVLTKPNGRLGAAYMAMIKPFRYLFVYPALMRMIHKEWMAATGGQPPART